MRLHPVVQEDMKAILDCQLPWEQLAGSTLLITGANGLISSYMVDVCMALNHSAVLAAPVHVLALVRNEAAAKKRFACYQDDPHLELVVQDVCDPITWKGSVDYIIHAASQASPKYYHTDPVGTLSANVIGTSNLLAFAKRQPLRSMLFLSSGEIYGQVSESCVPTKEEDSGYLDPMNIRSCYAESKRMAETMCASWHHQYGIPVKVVRPFHTYGPGMKLDDGRVFADFVANILERKDIIMTSPGDAVRAFCYLADATAGFFTVLLNGKNGEAYNIGNSDAAISIAELASILVNLYPDYELKVVNAATTGAYVPSPIKKNIPDISKVSLLGWHPATGVATGFHRTIESYSWERSGGQLTT